MFLFRAMNDFDSIIDPIKNGLASKELIYNATKRYQFRYRWRRYLDMLICIFKKIKVMLLITFFCDIIFIRGD